MPAAGSPFVGGLQPAPQPPLDPRTLRRILVVRADNTGDVVMAGPALLALREAAPSATITLLASPAGAKAVPLLPWVDDVLVERVSWQQLAPATQATPDDERRLVQRLADGSFDAAVILTSFSQTPWAAAHACLVAGIPVRAAQAADFGGAVLTHVVPPSPDGSHQVERNLHLVEALGMPAPERRLRVVVPLRSRMRAAQLLRAAGIAPGQPYVVLSPGASAAARRYPAGRFARVATLLRGVLPNLPLVLTGSRREAPLLARVAAVPGVTSLVGRTEVPELAALVEGAAVVVTAHSLPLHLGDALGRPMVVLFSGTDRRSEWGPRRAPSIVLGSVPACSPCRGITCPIDLPCLDIEPADVVDAVRSLLGGPTAGEAAWTA